MTQIEWRPYARHITLDTLTTVDFAVALPPTDSAKAHLHVARKHSTVVAIKKQLEDGHLAEGQIKSFVQRLTKEIEPNIHFFGEYALIGLCAVLETQKTAMAKTFLRDLSEWDGNQMPVAPRVAKEALRGWAP